VNLLHEVVGQNAPCMASLEDIQSAAVHGMKQTVAVYVWRLYAKFDLHFSFRNPGQINKVVIPSLLNVNLRPQIV
jgi:hypothetical protein